MAIVNSGQLAIYENIEKKLLTQIENLLFNKDINATDELTKTGHGLDPDTKKKIIN